MADQPENKRLIKFGLPPHPECPQSVEMSDDMESSGHDWLVARKLLSEARPPSRQYYDDENPGKPITRPR